MSARVTIGNIRLKPRAIEHPAKPDPEKPRFRISPEAVALSRIKAPRQMAPGIALDARSVFARAMPPPFVVPRGHKIAMDSWVDPEAAGWAFAGSLNEGVTFMGYPYLAELTQRPEYRRPAEILAKEMTRKWIRLLAPSDAQKGDRLKDLGKELIRLKVRDAFRNAIQTDGFFGRGHIYLDVGVKKGDPERAAPLLLNPAKIAKGSLRRLTTVEPMWTYPDQYNATDPLDETFYRPTTWFVNADRVHSSRLLSLIGREVPDMLKPAYSFGGLSLSQMGKPYVDNWLRARQSVSDLMHSFSADVIKTNMAAFLNEDAGAENSLLNRIAFFTNLRDNRGTMMLDKDTEDFVNVATPLGTLDKLQAQAQEHLSSVWGIPLVVLLGVTPSGLNASSDGEVRTFYAWVHAQQEDMLRDSLAYTLQVVQMSLWGEIDPDIDFDFVPLWQLSEKEMAEVREIEARTDTAYMDGGILDAEDVRLVLGNAHDPRYAPVDFTAPPPEPPEPEILPGMEGGGSENPFENQREDNAGAENPADPVEQEREDA